MWDILTIGVKTVITKINFKNVYERKRNNTRVRINAVNITNNRCMLAWSCQVYSFPSSFCTVIHVSVRISLQVAYGTAVVMYV